MIRTLIALTTLCYLTSSAALAATDGVAKVIILKGTVYAVAADQTKTAVSKNSWLKEGTVLQTEEKSFAKLLFIDKSQMNLGPSSEMKISEFPENKAGIITLMKGELRSQVTKNYMDMDKSEKSKLYIKTKTAAMGVRGTEFHVSFNPENLRTALVTLSGEVSFAQINPDVIAANIDRSALERVVSSSDAVLVTKGQFSGSSPDLQRATIPVTISPAQFEVIKNNDGTKEDSADQVNTEAPKKNFRSIVPPGMDAKAVANQEGGVEKAIQGAGSGAALAGGDAAPNKIDASSPPPEGAVNANTGTIAPTAGGFIDLKTAQYIPPPKGSSFDPVTKTYTPPASFGGFDPKTGNYKNDNFSLTSDGRFVAKDLTSASNHIKAPTNVSLIPQVAGAKVEGDISKLPMVTNSPSSATGRSPASVAGTSEKTNSNEDTGALDQFQQDLINEVDDNRQEMLNDIQEEVVERATRSRVIFTIQ